MASPDELRAADDARADTNPSATPARSMQTNHIDRIIEALISDEVAICDNCSELTWFSRSDARAIIDRLDREGFVIVRKATSK